MPKFEINFYVYEPKQGFAKVNYRNAFVLGSSTKKFTKNDLKTAVKKISLCMIDYNKGERGQQWQRSKNDKKNKT
jgi:predicted xylose isomerase-like sugar epimerase